MAETLSTFSIISFVAAGVFLVAAIVIFILFKIPLVIGDLTGKTAQKSIARLRAENEKSGKKSHQPSSVNKERGEKTKPIPTQESIGSESTTVLPDDDVTEALRSTESFDNVTDVLPTNDNYDATTELLFDLEEEGATTELLSDSHESTLFLSDELKKAGSRKPGGISLTMLDEVEMIHTDEEI